MSASAKALDPGSTLGILGGGQLGRMFALAARAMGYRVHVFVPEEDSPTGQVADHATVAAYDDLAALERFAQQVDAITFEFENIPSSVTNLLETIRPVRPGGALLHRTQHRLREKTALAEAGAPTVAFRGVRDLASLEGAIEDLGTPVILKTAAWGYDGKGQARIDAPSEAATAWTTIGQQEAILEAVAPFEREISVVGARGAGGEIELFEPTENEHRNHILDVSTVPARGSDTTLRAAREITRALLEAWDVVGVLCVEMFAMPDGTLVVNEIAPRPHNSGHLTIDAYSASQFEQQVRAVAGLPLARPRRYGAAAMANLLGDLWQDGEPNWAAALAEGASLHLYGKKSPRPGRKMGHLTVVADSVDDARERAIRARERLTLRP